MYNLKTFHGDLHLYKDVNKWLDKHGYEFIDKYWYEYEVFKLDDNNEYVISYIDYLENINKKWDIYTVYGNKELAILLKFEGDYVNLSFETISFANIKEVVKRKGSEEMDIGIQERIIKEAQKSLLDPHGISQIHAGFKIVNKLDRKIRNTYYWRVFLRIGKEKGRLL